MTAVAPRIVVTLPARDCATAISEVARARAAGADLAEVRFDRWDASERSRPERLFPSALPLIATLRSRAEGGEGPDDPGERARFLAPLRAHPFAAVDLEAVRDLAEISHRPGVGEPTHIVSTHLAASATAGDVARALKFAPAGAVRKVVVPATVAVALRELLPVLRVTDAGPRLLLTTGPSGALFRAWSYRLGFPLVFARLPPLADRNEPEVVEPSQVPVDDLRTFFDGGPTAPLFALLGHPVAHSQSPYLHGRWMRGSRRSGLYVALDVGSEAEFVEALPALASGGLKGVNITHPWKAVALATASRVDRAAEICGAANCLTLRGDEVEASNTDLAAILRRLKELRAEARWDGREILVVGAGGAAAATLAAARQLSVDAVVLARDAVAAGEIAGRFGARVAPDGKSRDFALVVHATPVGRAEAGGLEPAIGPRLRPGGLLLDWVYAADRLDLKEAAARAGCAYEDGWRLLVYQAAASFALWWGEDPPTSEVAAVLEEGPCTA
jgi:shikimate dehydrogenase